MIQKIINQHRIKFNTLHELFDNKYNKSKYKNSTIDIHIDLHSILSDLYKDSNYSESNYLEDKNSMIISSCIVNLAAHYRLFFHSRYKMNTKIYLYFANKKSRNNSEYYQSYGYKFFDKYSEDNAEFLPVNNEVSNNLKLTQVIFEYIPFVYYIDCGNIEPLIACNHMIKNSNNNSIILTKDEYWYQSVGYNSNTEILRLKRDDSYIINSDNIYKVLLKGKSYQAKYISESFLSVIQSFTGVKSRDIKSIKKYGYSTIIKILDQAVNKDYIPNRYVHIESILDEIYTGDKKEDLISIFNAIDIKIQLEELSKAQKTHLSDQIKDRYNKRDLVALNSKYYTGEDSLMLEELFRGITKPPLKW